MACVDVEEFEKKCKELDEEYPTNYEPFETYGLIEDIEYWEDVVEELALNGKPCGYQELFGD